MNFRQPSDNVEVSTVSVSRLRSALVHGSLALFAVAIIVRAAQLQLVEGRQWAEEAVKQQVEQATIAPPRGTIMDATGKVLVESRDLYRLDIVPRNVRNTDKHPEARVKVRRHLARLDLPAATIKRAMDTTVRWLPLKPLFLPSQVEAIAGLPGIRMTRVSQRQNSAPDGIRRIIGAMNSDGVPQGGLEEELDAQLRGTLGTSARLRDPRGISVETPLLSGTDAQPGNSVWLTVNEALQEIVERELKNGMQSTGATGGDIVLLDARDGSVLAMAGARNGKPASSTTALTESYEPGSVIKPLFIAHLLDKGLARESEVINTENGKWIVGGKPLVDEHKAASMSLHDIIRFSSNIGAVKLVQRLSSAEEYGVLRDFGFGQYSGVPFPSESRGALPLPATWTARTFAQLAIGYEMAVTPLQLATAYGVIASGGELLQPGLVREIRDPAGNVLYRHERRALRRVMSTEVAAQMRNILRSVVDSGTATAARLVTFDVAGKSGTAKMAVNGRYVDGRYNSSFAGMFPAQKPQVVFVARLMDPKGAYYGGVVAAPMINAILQAAIASRDGALDRAALAATAKQVEVKQDTTAVAEGDPDGDARHALPVVSEDSAPAPVAVAAPVETAVAPGRIVVSLSAVDTVTKKSSRNARKRVQAELRAVPLVAGLNVRQAVRTINSAGFNVKLVRGTSGRTSPAAGAMARVGGTVILEMSR